MPPFRTSSARDFSNLRIAEGGMGFVELVARRDGRFLRLFARKRLHPQLRSDPSLRSMFLDEARLAGLIRHPNVTAVLEVGEDAEGPFLLMEYVDGVTVAQVLERVEPRDSLLPLALCVSVVAQAARGLQAAHQLVSADGEPLGVVHRDISPNNLLLGYDGCLRVTDFGIAKARDNLEQTRVGVLKGNIGYMAPEYLSFKDVDQRSDLFALGVVLYELLTRERLYGGSDVNVVARRILDEPPPDIFEIRDVPAELCALSFELLAKDRELRPPNALTVATRLEEISAQLAALDGPFDIPSFLERELGQTRRERQALLDAAGARPATVPPHSDSQQASRRGRFPRARWLAVALLVLAALASVLSVRSLTRRRIAFEPGAAALWGGGRHNCALRDAHLVCWGSNDRGQLGDGTLENRAIPVAVQIGAVKLAVLGEVHSCALLSDGRVSCWGRNMRGELGRPEPQLSSLPLEVPGLGTATALAAGHQHTCALLTTGKVSCWGANDSGQLGRPASENIELPAEVQGLPAAVQIFAGGANTCARLIGGELVCWGANESGQLRNGSQQASATPVELPESRDLVSVAFGNNGHAQSQGASRLRTVTFACGRLRSGSVSCWGSNNTGQLGDGTREPRSGAVSVGGVTDAIEVAAGDLHACALLRSGAVSCWGRNEFGAVGDATMGPSFVRSTAATVVGIQDAVGLALGEAHSCVRRRNGAVACWGVNNFGQLGDGSALVHSSPAAADGFP